MFFYGCFYCTAAVFVVDVGVDQHFEQHEWAKAAAASAFIL
jgi:hypothetical protein